MIKWIKNKINLEEKHKDKEFQKLNSKIKFKQVTQVDLEQNQSKKIILIVLLFFVQTLFNRIRISRSSTFKPLS